MEKFLSENTLSELQVVFQKVVKEAWQKGFDEGVGSVASVEEYLKVDEPETVEHEGLLLRKVERESESGDFIRFNDLESTGTKNGEFYCVTDANQYENDEGTLLGVYGWLNYPEPEVFEVVSAVPQVIKSPNQQRAELNQWARGFVEEKLKCDSLIINHDFYKNPNIEFFSKGNKTTCVITPENTMLDRFVGRALCSDGDVFNEWIGKLISLYKALEIEIPQEFLDAVQPTEFVFGTIGRWTRKHDKYTFETAIDHDMSQDDLYSANKDLNLDNRNLSSSQDDWSAIIINDTNAVYE